MSELKVPNVVNPPHSPTASKSRKVSFVRIDPEQRTDIHPKRKDPSILTKRVEMVLCQPTQLTKTDTP